MTYRHGGGHSAPVLRRLDFQVWCALAMLPIWQAFAANDR